MDMEVVDLDDQKLADFAVLAVDVVAVDFVDVLVMMDAVLVDRC